MSNPFNTLREQIDQCTDAERRILYDYLKAKLRPHRLEQEWGVSAEIILSAISRCSDLTKRGVRGIIAEAVFERETLWGQSSGSPHPGQAPAHENTTANVGLRGQPSLACRHVRSRGPENAWGIDLQTNEDTRPYRFGEFDVLAVNMHPSTKDWHKFHFTLSRWLLPRTPEASLIEIFQPVTRSPNSTWTDNIETCLSWLASGEQKRILDIDPELLRRRRRQKPED